MRIAFLGCGNMAQALIRGVLAKGLYTPDNIVVADIDRPKRDSFAAAHGFGTADSNRQAVQSVEVVVLCVKPQQMQGLLDEIAGILSPYATVISIAAGIPVSRIAATLGNLPIVRAMPNTPALIGQGATGLFGGNAPGTAMDIALKIFSAVGIAIVVEQEGLIDSVTAVSGSGPAYYFLLMEEMIQTGISLGLSKETSTRLVLQTAKGAALLAESSCQSGQTPSVLRQKVTSPGGTTAAALNIFEQSHFSKIVQKALTAAHDRSRELSQ